MKEAIPNGKYDNLKGPSVSNPLSPDEIAAFHKNGYYLLRSVFTPDEMNACKQAAKEAVENQVGPSGVHVWMCDVIPPLFERIACDERLAGVLRQLIGPAVEFLSAKPVFKSGRITFASPWHQDYAYWGGATKYSVWIALEDATPENGCLRVIPGSHVKFFEHAHVKDVNGFGNRIAEGRLDGWATLTVPMHTGDALVFHDRLIHSSHPNTSGCDRWSFIPTYRDASVPDESTVWKTSKVL